jgi:hypothetical protein
MQTKDHTKLIKERLFLAIVNKAIYIIDMNYAPRLIVSIIMLVNVRM